MSRLTVHRSVAAGASSPPPSAAILSSSSLATSAFSSTISSSKPVTRVPGVVPRVPPSATDGTSGTSHPSSTDHDDVGVPQPELEPPLPHAPLPLPPSAAATSMSSFRTLKPPKPSLTFSLRLAMLTNGAAGTGGGARASNAACASTSFALQYVSSKSCEIAPPLRCAMSAAATVSPSPPPPSASRNLSTADPPRGRPLACTLRSIVRRSL